VTPWSLRGVDESAQDSALGHLQTLRDGRNARKSCRETTNVLLHVAQQLLQLIQHYRQQLQHVLLLLLPPSQQLMLLLQKLLQIHSDRLRKFQVFAKFLLKVAPHFLEEASSTFRTYIM